MDPNCLNSSRQDADTSGTGAYGHGPTVRSCLHPKRAQPLQPLSPGATLQMEGSITCSAAIAAVLNCRRHRMLKSHKKHTHHLFCSSNHSCGLNAIPFHTKNSWHSHKERVLLPQRAQSGALALDFYFLPVLWLAAALNHFLPCRAGASSVQELQASSTTPDLHSLPRASTLLPASSSRVNAQHQH